MEFTIFWLTGDTEIVEGDSISEAFKSAGYSGGAINAIDFYSPEDVRNDYEWNAKNHTWEKLND